ncbi:hypothetical protein KSD_25700 [Ktedonobacter sp. SOSP1-85]|nr:hypothetical protein KSD_25700 [Ktedonobacter sp. SOSP1-85]
MLHALRSDMHAGLSIGNRIFSENQAHILGLLCLAPLYQAAYIGIERGIKDKYRLMPREANGCIK